ncbi:Lmo0850 family protein [Phocicoccus pinnipedialis]|uniref:Uncharacterized protein n=1 Tax=Phocicoccus pinnipedialis TaxID=110845 RepID=A0A6V7R452_9BACL|nr:Lmo0850 family protein [Jeotgalicoccus pinnipedialis]MBP1939922.1 hypothetical protein [Jeotgalicoccus pinnipedialis]CAD2072130.1 hypothetical protein JEOPIN946_00328 [Jeotgalicoccus pinnipedialis]
MKNDNSKIKEVVEILRELGVRVSITPSRIELMKRISSNQTLRLNE